MLEAIRLYKNKFINLGGEYALFRIIRYFRKKEGNKLPTSINKSILGA